jgi:hypothetical protein
VLHPACAARGPTPVPVNVLRAGVPDGVVDHLNDLLLIAQFDMDAAS